MVVKLRPAQLGTFKSWQKGNWRLKSKWISVKKKKKMPKKFFKMGETIRFNRFTCECVIALKSNSIRVA